MPSWAVDKAGRETVTTEAVAHDLTICPNCGTPGFRLASEERVYGYASIVLEGTPVTGFTAEWGGETDMDWNSSTTMVYLCRDCDSVLPEWYAILLDGLLDNLREPTHTSEWHQQPTEQVAST